LNILKGFSFRARDDATFRARDDAKKRKWMIFIRVWYC
jgi:hypothetical protein